MGAGHPNRAVRLQHTLTASQPFDVEFVVQFRSARDVPISFIHLHHLAGVAGDAAVRPVFAQKLRPGRQEIRRAFAATKWLRPRRRVGEDGVEPAVGIFGGDGVEEFEAVAVVEPDAACGVGEGKARRHG